MAAAIGGFGGAVSIGLALAFNQVSNDVAAFIAGADTGVSATSGDITVRATSASRAPFTLGHGITATDLDNAATAEQDDPNTTRRTSRRST